MQSDLLQAKLKAIANENTSEMAYFIRQLNYVYGTDINPAQALYVKLVQYSHKVTPLRNKENVLQTILEKKFSDGMIYILILDSTPNRIDNMYDVQYYKFHMGNQFNIYRNDYALHAIANGYNISNYENDYSILFVNQLLMNPLVKNDFGFDAEPKMVERLFEQDTLIRNGDV